MAAHRRVGAQPPPQRVAAIVNSGFPEARQNAVALAICREFAAQSGMGWAGGLVLTGGGMIGGRPLTEKRRSAPPVKHMIQSLDLTTAALAEGLPVPPAAMRLMARNPLPFLPFALWRWIYIRFGGNGFEQEAASNGIRKSRLLDQPYAA